MSSRLHKPSTRREMLRLMGLGIAGTALAACATPTPQIIEKIVEKPVEKVVEKVVKETVVTEKQVEKVVQQTVVVEKEKQVEKVVTATAVPSPLKRLEGKKGRLWGLQYDPHVATYNNLAILFREHTGALLNVEPQAWPLETKLIAALAAGTQPDVACIMGKMLVPLYIQKGLLPLRDSVYNFMKVNPDEVFFADGVYAYSWQGELYGVPTEAGGLGNVVSVPVDEVKKMGLADKYPPTNGKLWWTDYPEIFTLGKALQIEKDGKVQRWGLSSKGWDGSSVIGMMRSLFAEKGTDWWDVGKQKFNVDTDEGVQAVKWFAEDPVNMGIETELDQSHVDAALAGKVALARGNGTPVLSDVFGILGYNFELAGVPMCVPGKPPLSCSEAGWGFCAPRATKNPDISTEFLKMMVTVEGQTMYARSYGGIAGVAMKQLVGKFDHWANPDPEQKVIRFAKAYQTYLAPLARYYGEALGYYGEVDRIFGEDMSNVRQKKMTAKQAVQDMQKQLEAQYKQWQEDVKAAA
ncbi:MAG: hypothetical protein IT330_06670 [Anaerolineae bacterium]|nr:hypothetical protein [Anaerolineae bacterium]